MKQESSDKVHIKYMRVAIKVKAENIQHAGDQTWFGKLNSSRRRVVINQLC